MSRKRPTPAAARAASAPRERNPMTDLRSASVGAACYERYHTHTTAFLSWLQANHGPPAPILLRPALLGGLLERYIQHLWGTRAPRSHATNAVFGLSFFFSFCRDALAGPRRLLKGWECLEPSARRPPIPFTVVQLLALRWAAQARHDLAIGVLLAFECYLRPSELCDIYLADISWARTVRHGETFAGSIALRTTKTGANMEVLLRANHTTTLLQGYIRTKSSQPGTEKRSDRLFAFSTDQFRARMSDLLEIFGLSYLHFTLHCLRHGGATRDRKLGLSMLEIQDRGRWAQLKSCQRYVQIWSSLAIQMQLPPHIDNLLRQLQLSPDVTTDAFMTAFRVALAAGHQSITSIRPPTAAPLSKPPRSHRSY